MESKKTVEVIKGLTADIIGGFLYAVGIYFFAKSADFAPGGPLCLYVLGPEGRFHVPAGARAD